MTDDATFLTIRAVINRYDPEDLLNIAPEDEYDPEVREFSRLVHGQQKITGEAVAAIWLKWFGCSDWPTERPAEPIEIAADLERLRLDHDRPH